MNQLDRHFHRAQARRKSKALRASFKGQSDVAPLFTDLQSKENDQRIAEYEQRMARYTGVAA